MKYIMVDRYSAGNDRSGTKLPYNEVTGRWPLTRDTFIRIRDVTDTLIRDTLIKILDIMDILHKIN